MIEGTAAIRSTSETSVFQFQVSRLQALLSAAEGALKSAIASEAAWLAAGDDVRFMNDVAVRMQP